MITLFKIVRWVRKAVAFLIPTELSVPEMVSSGGRLPGRDVKVLKYNLFAEAKKTISASWTSPFVKGVNFISSASNTEAHAGTSEAPEEVSLLRR